MPARLNMTWSPAELAVLQSRYVLGTRAELEQLLPGRHWDTIRNKATSLGLLRRPGERHWSPEEEEYTRQHYATKGGHHLAQHLGRTHTAVLKKAALLGLRLESFGKTPRKTNWSEQHLTVLREQYPAQGAEHVAALVGRKPAAVVTMAKRLGIRSRRRPAGRARWSAEHTALLQKHYPANLPMPELVRLLERKPGTIMAMACLLGLKRPPRVATPKPAKAQQPKPAPAPKLAPVAKAKPAPKKAAKAPRNFGYTPEQEQKIREQFPCQPTAVLAAEIGKSEDAVRHFATRVLGLVKTPAYLAARAAELAEQRLIKKKAKAQAEKKAQKKSSPGPAKWWTFPMNSAEYKAGLAATTAGKKPITIIDSYGRPATVWRNAA